jgi:hypothetical protein
MCYSWRILDEEFFALAEFAHERNFKVLRFAALWLTWAAVGTSFLCDDSYHFPLTPLLLTADSAAVAVFPICRESGSARYSTLWFDDMKFINFTFFELCIVMYLWKNQQNAHFLN